MHCILDSLRNSGELLVFLLVTEETSMRSTRPRVQTAKIAQNPLKRLLRRHML